MNSNIKNIFIVGLGTVIGFWICFALGGTVELTYANHALDIELSAGLFGTILGYFTAERFTLKSQD